MSLVAQPPNVHLRVAHLSATTKKPQSSWRASLSLRRSATALRFSAAWARDHLDSRHLVASPRSLRGDQRTCRRAVASATPETSSYRTDTARIYFNSLATVLGNEKFAFDGRTRRPVATPSTRVVLLWATTETTGACDAIGLDPQIGFLHQALRAGRPSLALDLTEELRALTDRFVVSALRLGKITPEHFAGTPGGGCYMTDSGRREMLSLWEDHKNTYYNHAVLDRPVQRWAIPTTQATLMARWLRGDLPGYPPFLLES